MEFDGLLRKLTLSVRIVAKSFQTSEQLTNV